MATVRAALLLLCAVSPTLSEISPPALPPRKPGHHHGHKRHRHHHQNPSIPPPALPPHTPGHHTRHRHPHSTSPLLAAATPSGISSAQEAAEFKSDLLIGLALFGGSAFVWQTPVLMDGAINAGLGLSAEQSIEASTAMFAAWAVGSTALGALGDMIGRKKVAIASGAAGVLHLLIIARATGMRDLVLARLIGGFALGGMMQGGFAWACDSVEGAARKSATAANTHYCNAAVVFLLLGVHLVCVNRGLEWRGELTVFAGVLGLLVAACGLLIPAFPSWRAETRANTLAAVQDPTHLDSNESILDYWKPLAISCLAFVAGSTVWYLLSFSAGSLSSNLVLNIALISLMDLPGYALADVLGHDPAIGIQRGSGYLFGACGVLLLLLAFGTSMELPVSAAAFLGKMMVAGAFQLACLLPGQDLPESMRGTGLGIASTAARTALILVPTLARAVRLEVSSVLCAALALVAGSALVLTAP